jgi:hypothetical protein
MKTQMYSSPARMVNAHTHVRKNSDNNNNNNNRKLAASAFRLIYTYNRITHEKQNPLRQ